MLLDKEKLNEIKNQLEYYLSDENLKKDSFFHQIISSEPDGYINIDYFLKCKKIQNKKWTKNELIEGIKESEELELDKNNEKVRRKNNKELPELILLSQKRKKENENKEKKEEEKLDKIILKIISNEDIKVKWQEIISNFKKENPNVNVNYCRFKNKIGYISILKTSNEEISYKDNFKIKNVIFNIEKCEKDDLKKFYNVYGEHYENCTNKEKKEKKKIKKNKSYLENSIILGGEKYNDLTLIKNHMKNILNEIKDNEKIIGKNKEFIEDILKYHHNYNEKIKDIDYITVGKYDNSNYNRCFFIIKKNGEKVDFSIKKCIDNLISKTKE